MKKKTRIITYLISALVILAIAVVYLHPWNNKKVNKSGFYNSSLKLNRTSTSSKTKKIEDSKESNSTSKSSGPLSSVGSSESMQEGTQSSDTDISAPQSSSVDTNQNVSTGVNVASLALGDVSTIVGTWSNNLGESLIVSEEGQITNNSTGKVYSLLSNGVDGNVFYGSIYNPNSATDSAAFIVIPDGTVNPYGAGTASSDSILVGQGDDAGKHPFYRN